MVRLEIFEENEVTLNEVTLNTPMEVADAERSRDEGRRESNDTAMNAEGIPELHDGERLKQLEKNFQVLFQGAFSRGDEGDSERRKIKSIQDELELGWSHERRMRTTPFESIGRCNGPVCPSREEGSNISIDVSPQTSTTSDVVTGQEYHRQTPVPSLENDKVMHPIRLFAFFAQSV